MSDKLKIWDYEDWAVSTGSDMFSSIIAFYESPEMIFVTSRDLYLGAIDVDSKTYNVFWPLIRWEHQKSSSLIDHNYINAGLFDGMTFEEERVGAGAGCYGDTPLRYGDIEGDGSSELVIDLNGLMFIFSPYYERVVFSTRVKFHDFVSDELMEEDYSDDVDDSLSQNISFISTLNNYSELVPGIRVYSKIYTGDFDKDGSPDIVVWHKGYQSNLKSDAEKGFNLVESSWTHYERYLTAQAASEEGVTGEYLPQETSEADIKNWLTENNLTWSQGYPSKSECPGEEGQLIPEMHDPLLNDPEVLQ